MSAAKKQPETKIIKPGHPDYMQPATKEIMQLMDKGLSPEDACKLVKGKDIIHRNTVTDIKQKYAKWSLTSESMQKLSHNAVKDTLKMKPVKTKEVKPCPECKVGDKIDTCTVCGGSGVVPVLLYPSHTNRMAAVAMVADRVDPVIKQSMNLNTNIHAFVGFEGEANGILDGLKS